MQYRHGGRINPTTDQPAVVVPVGALVNDLPVAPRVQREQVDQLIRAALGTELSVVSLSGSRLQRPGAQLARAV
jgi:hypothetical protein